MHDKPGVIIVSLQSNHLKEDLESAFSQATFVFANDTIAVFKRGYDQN